MLTTKYMFYDEKSKKKRRDSKGGRERILAGHDNNKIL